jgi:hypothetical protein
MIPRGPVLAQALGIPNFQAYQKPSKLYTFSFTFREKLWMAIPNPLLNCNFYQQLPSFSLLLLTTKSMQLLAANTLINWKKTDHSFL